MRAVFLNGPPRSGKDTIGSMLYSMLPNCFLWKFANPIVNYMHSNFGVSCNDGHDKDLPCPELNGLSRRQVAIKYSEEWIKPNFGPDWFGREAVKHLTTYCRGRTDYVVFTDSGFLEETEVISDALGIDNCLQVRLFRQGCDFSNDSRGYWQIPGLMYLNFYNDMELELLSKTVADSLVPRILQRW